MASMIGSKVERKEDKKFLTGKGRYTADINLHNQLHAVFIRSPHARAKIKGIDISKAKKAAGVVDVLTGKDMQDGKIAGLPTGFRDLDKKLGGLHKSDLIIIAGRPSMGKTALGTNIAFNCAIKFKEQEDDLGEKILVDGGKVAFFSLEMSSEQLATRILAERCRISGDKMRKAKLSKDDFKKIANTSSE